MEPMFFGGLLRPKGQNSRPKAERGYWGGGSEPPAPARESGGAL